MKAIKSLLFAMPLLAFAACSSDSPEVVDEPVVPIPDVVDPVEFSVMKLNNTEKRINDAQNDFGIRLFTKGIESGDIKENDCISPLSLHGVLTMAANADSGEKKDAILRCLFGSSDAFSMEEINTFSQKMIEGLPATEADVKFGINNSLWGLSAENYNDDFLKAMNDYYSTFVSPASPMTQSGVNQINEWVSKNTRGLIGQFLEYPMEIPLMMINTLYFKAPWRVPFEMDETSVGDFKSLNGTVNQKDMMRMTGNFNYAEANGNKMLSLDFGDGNFRMDFILPSENNDFRTFTANLGNNIKLLESGMSSEYVAMSIPKFEAAYKSNVTELIDKLSGNKLLGAGFDRYTKEGKHSISFILHNVVFKINEGGAEGAAASGIALDGCAGEESEVMTFNLNRPFLYLVREINTGAILFIGQVTK